MTNETQKTRLSVGMRAVLLALGVMSLVAFALAAPARLRADTPQENNTAEMLIFDWNKPVIIGMSGFAQYKPLSDYPQFPNGNWVSPTNFTQGTLYFRARVISMPTAQGQPGMKIGFCFWQQRPQYGEECTKNYAVPGVAGQETRWNQSFSSLFKIKRAAIDWTQPRYKEGFVVRNSRGKPVSKKLGLNWSGENPRNWYPMNIHLTVVLVAQGGGEPDWTRYGWPTR